MLRGLLSLFFKLLLRLRYGVSIHGLERLNEARGCLILANHPAQIDPVILCSYLWRKFRPRPVVLEKYYFIPGLRNLMNLLGAFPMPDMTFDAGPYKKKRIARGLEQAARALAAGDNVLLYPSGRIMRSGYERLGANSGAQTLLALCPGAKVVLVRTRGLYGSIFSRAVSGAVSPDLAKAFRQALWILIENLILFAPRRWIQIHVEEAPADMLALEGLAFNRALEAWFNQEGEDAPRYIPQSFWRKRCAVPAKREDKSAEAGQIPPEIMEKIVKQLSEASGLGVDKITPESRLSDDLGLDSLSLAELVSWLDEEFGVTDVQLEELLSVGALARVAAGAVTELPEREDFNLPPGWLSEAQQRPAPGEVRGLTLTEAFLNCCERMDGFYAVGDRSAGVLEWGRLKAAVIALAACFRAYPGRHLGIMLPASCGSLLATMAALFAGKIPVMINWTAGRRNVEHALALSGVDKVVSSRAFLDRLSVDIEFLEDKIVLLEDLKRGVGLFRRFRALLMSLLWPGLLRLLSGARREKAADTAVILFTSGSEAAPKGVALSHENILSNIRGAVSAIEFRRDDVLLGFLPPFHSFGLTVCCFLPAVSGLKAAYFPNPNEARKLAGESELWGASVLAGTPTFLKSMLKAGSPEQFAKLRLLVAGAERAPDDLFALASAVSAGAQVLEGYGITECSPVVSVNRPGRTRCGVGEPLAGVELLIVSPETHQPVAPGEMGLVLIRGPNVFGGYLGGAPDPFLRVNGLEWYNSGDLGRLQEGKLVLAGRLKRFVKIAGEMISLPAVEECLQEKWPSPDGSPGLAVVSREMLSGERPPLMLFTALSIDAAGANEALRQAGFPNLVRIAKVARLDAIPLLGSGKVDIKALEELAREMEGEDPRSSPA